jgi:hypothetical protein
MTGDKEIVSKQILPYLSPPLQHIIMHLNDRFFASLEEIRLRSGQPLIMKIGDKDAAVISRESWQGVLTRLMW